MFVETALKQSNPHCAELGIEPIENSLRSELGISISPDNLGQLTQKLEELEDLGKGFSSKMELLEKKLFYNSEGSYQQGVDYIMQQIAK